MPASTRPGEGAAVPPMSAALAAFALALLLGLQPVTTDLYLPSLPMLTRELGAPMTMAQLTMSALMLAFGVGQLVWGPVADRVGRRPVLLAGLALYTLASAGCAAAPDIQWLVGWRVLQGACLAAAVVVARAIVRDLYEPMEGARVMARALSGLGVIAMCAPATGGLVATVAGWRGALGVVALCGAALWAVIALKLPETIERRNPHAIAPGPLLASWARIARDRSFVAWATLVACTYGGLFTILAGSSFVYISMLGLAPAAYGAVMASGSIAYIAGTLLCRRWIPRRGLAGTVRVGALFTLAAGVLIVAAALLQVRSVAAVLVAQWLFCIGHGLHQPCGQAGAVGPFPRAAGTASALAGFVLSVTAFAIGRYLGLHLADGLVPFALCLGFWSAATCTVAWTLVQRLAK